MGNSSSHEAHGPGYKEASEAFGTNAVQRMQQHYTKTLGSPKAALKDSSAVSALFNLQSATLQKCFRRALEDTAESEAALLQPGAPSKGSSPSPPAFTDALVVTYRLSGLSSKFDRLAAAWHVIPGARADVQTWQEFLSAAFAHSGVPPADGTSPQALHALASGLQEGRAASGATPERFFKCHPFLLDLCARLVDALSCLRTSSGPASDSIASPSDSARVSEQPSCSPASSGPDLLSLPESALGRLVLCGARRKVLESLLPAAQRERWQLLFHSDLHGKSFATFTSRIMERGPTLVVVRDKQGAVFGGYASEDWRKQGSFYGNSGCFLYRLAPTYSVHFAAGINENFQWCGVNFKQLPNGIGFGGQVGYYSLIINDTLDSGMSRPAATFAAPSLASNEKFEVDCVECWLVEQPEEDTVAATGTAMDRFKEDKFLLEMHGKTLHSDAYRAPEPIE